MTHNQGLTCQILGMYSMRYAGILVFLLISFLACQTGENAPGQETDAAFFDLRSFFQAEITRLEKAQPSIKKEIEINGEKEDKVQDSIDFEKELAIFVRADINKPAWRDKYQIDSVMEAQNLKTLRYTALDSSLKTRALTIDFNQNDVERIFILNQTNSPLIKSEQQLTFEPQSGYFIRNKQSLSLSKNSDLTIKALFVN